MMENESLKQEVADKGGVHLAAIYHVHESSAFCKFLELSDPSFSPAVDSNVLATRIQGSGSLS
jgi:hypothetical protein